MKKFISRIAKPLSEFVILTILEENPKIHTYEIQQILDDRFLNMDDPLLVNMKILEDILSEVIQSGYEEKKIGKQLQSLQFESLITPLQELFRKARDDAEILDLLNKLKEELSVLNILNANTGEIWKSKTGIYQTMRELEKYNLIEVSDQVIVNGRTRKLYEITQDGKQEAIQMLFTFLSLNDFVIPSSPTPSENLLDFFREHKLTFENIMEKLDLDADTHEDLYKSSTPYLSSNPFLVNQFNLIVQILQRIPSSEVKQKNKSLIGQNEDNELLITKLKEFQNKIGLYIDQLEKK